MSVRSILFCAGLVPFALAACGQQTQGPRGLSNQDKAALQAIAERDTLLVRARDWAALTAECQSQSHGAGLGTPVELKLRRHVKLRHARAEMITPPIASRLTSERSSRSALTLRRMSAVDSESTRLWTPCFWMSAS